MTSSFDCLLNTSFSRVVFCGVYYGNSWQSLSFPFLSQGLFYANGTSYNQTLVLNENFEVDPVFLAEQGLPFYAGTWVIQLMASNLASAATVTHMILWNRDDIRAAWDWLAPSTLCRSFEYFTVETLKFWEQGAPDQRMAEVTDENIDPHYRKMLKYPDAPSSWYAVIVVVSCVTALAAMYDAKSTLPWWGFFISLGLGTVLILFCGTFTAITGTVQSFSAMMGGFVLPGKPMANMYFVLFSYSRFKPFFFRC